MVPEQQVQLPILRMTTGIDAGNSGFPGVPGAPGFDFRQGSPGGPSAAALERFGIKLTPGGAHISRTMMLVELEALLAAVPANSPTSAYREAILERNVLGKATVATRQKSLRHLRELYAVQDSVPIFGLLRELHGIDPASLPLLAFQVAWARDSLLRATTGALFPAAEGSIVGSETLSDAVEKVYPGQYSEPNYRKVGRNATTSWRRSGHLSGRARTVRLRVVPSATAVTLALFLGQVCGFHGEAVFASPWCRLLDLAPEQARLAAIQAHRAGLLNLRAIGVMVEISFPLLAKYAPGTPHPA